MLKTCDTDFDQISKLCMSVVSIGTNPTFKVKKVPMEYFPSMQKRLNFFGSTFCLFNYTSSIFLLYFLRKKSVRNNITPPSHCARQVNSWMSTVIYLNKYSKSESTTQFKVRHSNFVYSWNTLCQVGKVWTIFINLNWVRPASPFLSNIET